MTDLAEHIRQTMLIDTHEHLAGESQYVDDGPDVLMDLFDNYVPADLLVAGASPDDVNRLTRKELGLAERFKPLERFWRHCRFTGHGEAVRYIAREAYGIDEINVETLEAAQRQNERYRAPGQRLRVLQNVRIDHVQIDDWIWACHPDPSGPDFFLYDLNWMDFAEGKLQLAQIHKEIGVEVKDLATLDQAMSGIFDRYAGVAIALKTQHAYTRTLRWQARDDSDVSRALSRYISDTASDEDRLCLGDWCLGRGVTHATSCGMPIKIHTGYYCFTGRMPLEYISPTHLTPLLRAYPDARFVLMHIGYPYASELVAIAKHYPNVYADLCWAWSIDPHASAQFVRQMIHAVPVNKLFAFGGDARWPNAAAGYAAQARYHLTRVLEAEVRERMLTEPQAIALATRFMFENQMECFDISGRRRRINELMTIAANGDDLATQAMVSRGAR